MKPAALDEIAPRHRPADFKAIGYERRDTATPAIKLVELQTDANPNLTEIHVSGETHTRLVDTFVLANRREMLELMDPVESLAVGVVFGSNRVFADMASKLPMKGANDAVH